MHEGEVGVLERWGAFDDVLDGYLLRAYRRAVIVFIDALEGKVSVTSVKGSKVRRYRNPTPATNMRLDAFAKVEAETLYVSDVLIDGGRFVQFTICPRVGGLR